MKEGGYRIQGQNTSVDDATKVTVVTAVYNGEQYLEQTITSILEQTYKDIELIIIDGASTDKTVAILEKYNNRIAYWISEPDKGIYDAWNKAIIKAKGEWICFIGSDDILLPDALENYVKHIEDQKLQDYQFISSVIQLTDLDLIPKRRFGREWKWRSHKIEMRAAHVGALHHKQLFNMYGLFDESYKIAGDYELLLRPRDQLKASFLDTLTVQMRCGGASNTNLLVFKESLKAKITTAKRNKLTCITEYYYLLLKFYFLKILR